MATSTGIRSSHADMQQSCAKSQQGMLWRHGLQPSMLVMVGGGGGCLLHCTSPLCKGLHNNCAETRCTTRARPVPAGHDRHVGTSKASDASRSPGRLLSAVGRTESGLGLWSSPLARVP